MSSTSGWPKSAQERPRSAQELPQSFPDGTGIHFRHVRVAQVCPVAAQERPGAAQGLAGSDRKAGLQIVDKHMDVLRFFAISEFNIIT